MRISLGAAWTFAQPSDFEWVADAVAVLKVAILERPRRLYGSWWQPYIVTDCGLLTRPSAHRSEPSSH
jgi:hypothetical protein